ncbi:MAG: UbiA family prenyltransferase [Ignavibacteria bacterium]|nr:UbiA family prenyltransferase [Ignavibacteria bacterium]
MIRKVKILYKQLRVYQWVKNILIFLPLLLAHRITETNLIVSVVISFVAFSCVASAVYILNDFLDLKHDRIHPIKKFRPLAAGLISTNAIVVVFLSLVFIATLLCVFFLNTEFALTLVAYSVMSILYAVYVKRLVIADVLLLSGLYVIRLAAGGAAANVQVSTWLLGFSLFLFTSLAFLKRYSELLETIDRDVHVLPGRGYVSGDSGFIFVAGPALGFISVLVFTFYLNSFEVRALYKHADVLWLLVPCMIYWISRLWLLAHRGRVNQDPILFTFTDGPSYLVGGLAALIVIVASI